MPKKRSKTAPAIETCCSPKTLRRHDALQSINPMRQLNWRWKRAMSLVERNRRALSSRDDEFTCRAVSYLRECQRAKTDDQLDRVAAKFRDLHLAAMIYKESDFTRWLLEARLLTRQDFPAIAKASGLPVDVVEAYEVIFFNVRDRLGANAFIMLQTMPKVVRDEVTENDIATILKFLAYHGGPVVLETVAPYLLAPPASLKHLPATFAATAKRVRQFVSALVDSRKVKGSREPSAETAIATKEALALPTRDRTAAVTQELIRLLESLSQEPDSQPAESAETVLAPTEEPLRLLLEELG